MWTVSQLPRITFRRENTRNINLTFDMDITGATVYFTVKKTADNDSTDASAVIKKDVTTHTDPVAGKTSNQLSATDTDVLPGKYGYDIKLETAGGDHITLGVGRCDIKTVYTLRA